MASPLQSLAGPHCGHGERLCSLPPASAALLGIPSKRHVSCLCFLFFPESQQPTQTEPNSFFRVSCRYQKPKCNDIREAAIYRTVRT